MQPSHPNRECFTFHANKYDIKLIHFPIFFSFEGNRDFSRLFGMQGSRCKSIYGSTWDIDWFNLPQSHRSLVPCEILISCGAGSAIAAAKLSPAPTSSSKRWWCPASTDGAISWSGTRGKLCLMLKQMWIYSLFFLMDSSSLNMIT